ncbi:CYFA0S02e05864g1_1 [Cyberlindnera fabianii]|uniref:pantothenate kinase n=1 Tax=Cyberlindnera fabianii TaxID=36022 RepID=A0A061AVN8_CYBFA|nr:CYFA0S02e05864g1_1 [Cyberlindnera fabianii]
MDPHQRSNLKIALNEPDKPFSTVVPCNRTAQPRSNYDRDYIGLDIGGTLTKVVYTMGSAVFLEKFATESIEEVLSFLEQLICRKELNFAHVVTTGGGSQKFNKSLSKLFTEKHGIPVLKKDEMESLILGLDFFIRDVDKEVFVMDHVTEKIRFLDKVSVKYPYMLVNIGSGVSILRVDGPGGQYKRVGGSSLGGGTLWGLLSLITNCGSYESMLQLSEQGDNRNVDMLVGDIYGTDYNSIGLKSSTIASSFGKVFKKEKNDTLRNNRDQVDQADIAKSLIYAISNNIGQISYLHANINNVTNIYFGGSYISAHKFIIKTLSYAINFWSKGDMKAHFLKHDGYIGAIGSFLTTAEHESASDNRSDADTISQKLDLTNLSETKPEFDYVESLSDDSSNA